MIQFETKLSVREIARALQDEIRLANGITEPYESPSGALAEHDDEKAIAIVARGRSGVLSLSGFWAVEVLVFEQKAARLVRMVAWGDGSATRIMSGSKNTLSLSLSMKKREAMAAKLR
jgi:hypothetical protein